jgi:hypothetical protein
LRGVATPPSGRLAGRGLRAAALKAGVFFSLVLPSHLLASEAAPAGTAATALDEAEFLKASDAAMVRMMKDMEIRPTGDIDRDFVAMMSPHHQGAIDMAIAELRYGRNEQLRRIAQEIIVDQMQEIDAMRFALGEKVTASAPAPTQPNPAPTSVEHHHLGTPAGASSAMTK